MTLFTTLFLAGVNWKEAWGKASGPVWLPPETTTSTLTPMKTFLFLVDVSFQTWFTGWHYWYKPDAEVCNYFTFAEQGVAVTLQPGDILLFNPVYKHCVSSHTSAYETKDMFSLSTYLKLPLLVWMTIAYHWQKLRIISCGDSLFIYFYVIPFCIVFALCTIIYLFPILILWFLQLADIFLNNSFKAPLHIEFFQRWCLAALDVVWPHFLQWGHFKANTA
jgi:hypothetical protein